MMHQNSSSKKMEEDRISQLPDEILQQILLLIDINQAVQTTILSSRWKNLWCSLSDLHFHLSRFTAPSRATLENRKADQALTHRFTHFVSHFLSHRDAAATIRNFHLSIDNSLVYADHTLIEKFMHYAVNHGVQSLRLHVSFSPELTPRGTVFASQTLRELELKQFGYVTYFPEQFFFPHLKTLHLKSYIFVYGSYTISREPFSGFPELEKLTLRRCIVWGIVLKAPRLRFLEIIGDRGGSYFPRGMIADEISAPLLTGFRYEGFSDLECSKLNLPMLEEVYLDIYKRVIMKGMHLKCVRMLQQLGNATTVALTLDTLTVLATDRCFIEQSPSPFPYMKRLKFIKGRREISTELQSVMNYLTVGTLHYESLMVEVVEENLEDLSDDDDDDNELLGVFELFELFE